MASDRNDTGLALFLTGLALGAALGVLLAPASGAETRRKIGEKVRTLKDEAEEEFAEGLEKIRTEFPERKDRYSEAIKEGWKAFRQSVAAEKSPQS
ncbi:MAG: YtxH domain-containing protein [Nitrospiraceae bacterium]|jgi:gas vesicle protein|nr:YtxH domain-containing protein [Nitrospiraceae bacterium]